MSKVFLEYIWLDGSNPQKLRSKTMVKNFNLEEMADINNYPIWSFDGSSTGQAKAGKGENTDCVLKPIFVTQDPFRGGDNKLVLCMVFNSDGETPHETNHRYHLREFIKKHPKLSKTEEDYETSCWFGWEQEYTLTTKDHEHLHKFGSGEGLPLGHEPGPKGSPRPQGDYYCGIGSDNVIGRKIVEEHLQMCTAIGLSISGINAEVMLGQWEYQIGPVNALNGSDELWVSRYILGRVAEKYDVLVSFHPKPLTGDWNGSGCHVNFSSKEMRERGGFDFILESMYKLEHKHKEHINVYGLDNNKRMTGEHETSNIEEFSWGISTRDTSIRIPVQTKLNNCGYFEDRRPASNCDPYQVSLRMLQTVFEEITVEKPEMVK